MRRDVTPEIFVVVLSNAIHLAAGTTRLITCPFIPGQVDTDAMALVVPVQRPEGVALPELVQWLPTAAIGDPIGNIGAAALKQASDLVTALIT